MCGHTRGFTHLTVVDPRPGEPPQVLEGTCLGPCGQTRYFDRAGNLYLTAEDAASGQNAERRTSCASHA